MGKGVVSKRKGLFLGQLLFRGAGNGRGLIRQITSLALVRKFQVGWCKIPLLGRAAAVVRSVTEFWFRDAAWLSESDWVLARSLSPHQLPAIGVPGFVAVHQTLTRYVN